MAVYTHISETEVIEYLKNYNIGEFKKLEPITNGVQNSNYYLTTTNGKYILTIFEKTVSEENLPFYLGFMQHLHKNGIPCPDLIVNKNGLGITDLKNKKSAITSFIKGTSPESITIEHIKTIAKTLAKMDGSVKDFKMQAPNTANLSFCEELIDKCGDKLEQIESGLYQFLKNEFKFLNNNMPTNLPCGAIHADLFPDNTLLEDNELKGVIDFYFSYTGAFIYSVMITLNAWCFDKFGKIDKEKAETFLNSYKAIRPLSENEETYLNFFGRITALRILSTRLFDYTYPAEGSIVKTKDPKEYLNILKFYQAGGI